MLWTKGWMETRLRLAFSLGVAALALGVRYSDGLVSVADARRLMGAVSTICMIASGLLAGAGVRTIPAFKATKGLHESIYFTLSLPVTRLRLLAVRCGIGLLATWGMIAVVVGAEWGLFPLVRANSTPGDLIRFILVTCTFVGGFHFLSVLLATFLDDRWVVVATMAAYELLLASSPLLPLPLALNIFRCLDQDSPLLTHSLPWSQLAVCTAMALLFFLAARRVVETREY